MASGTGSLVPTEKEPTREAPQLQVVRSLRAGFMPVPARRQGAVVVAEKQQRK